MGIKKFKPVTPTLRKKQVMDSKDLTKGVKVPSSLLKVKKVNAAVTVLVGLRLVTKVAV